MELKPEFEKRIKELLKDEKDFEAYKKIIYEKPRNFIRCNTLKISTENLVKRLSEKWKISQPFKEHPEIILINSSLNPGEIGKSIEHILGYYYVQEISSMMSVIALNPKKEEFVLDLCAAPGSKTTQMAACMENKGTIIANDLKLDRIKILSANLQRCGVSNTITTFNDAIALCSRLAEKGYKFDKILVDAPCSGEGTFRSVLSTFKTWNPNVIISYQRLQKKLVEFALKCLKKDGILVYSTCTHAPEENEEVVDFIIKKFPVDIEETKLPLKTRQGILSWQGKEFDKSIVKK